MANNPLQSFFRQPKVYIKLPSIGAYNRPGVIQGDVSSMPVYGMTGMDEIIMKTPDALLSGESTVKVFESCCPGIKDGWDISSLDSEVLLTAIRIATYGNYISVKHTCKECDTESAYDIDLGKIIEHFSKCQYNNKIVLKDLVIKTQPLNYKQNSEFALKNFRIQQQLSQTGSVEDDEERKKIVAQLFIDLSKLQVEIFTASIEAIEANNSLVTEKSHIAEFLTNCDATILDSIKEQFAINKDAWIIPPYKAICENCSTENDVYIELDQSNFFAKA